MSKEKKRPRLSFKEKYELAGQVKAGISKQEILRKYGISDKTYRRVLARESDLNDKVKNYQYLNKKSSKSSDNMVLEDALIEWFKSARDRGDPISGPIMQEKALIFNEKLNGSQTFKASNGWFERFKKRYGIRLKGEKSSSDPSGAAEFSPILRAKIESENLKPDNIYNADESGIFWRLLMACSFALREEAEALGRKECKDRVTTLFCANASGSHRIPLLTIGKSENPRCLENLITENLKDLRLKNLESLGVIYTHQDRAWMDKCIFLLWYKDVFIPRVLERQRKDEITGKVVLLLDSAPSHPSLDELNAINENFEVVYLPHNVTALIQPMAQGLIATTKKLYKKDLLTRLLLSENLEGPVQFLKELDLSDCFGMLSLAWDALESSTLQKAWKPLLLARQGEEDPLFIDDTVLSEPESPIDLISLPHEICYQVSELFSGPDYSVKQSREYLLKWFENDDNDCGWESLSDSDILNLVTNGRSEPENPDMVNFVTCGKLEPEIVCKLEKSETMFKNSDVVSLGTTGGREPEIVTGIENSETMFENPDMVNFVTCGKREPEIVNKNENSETMFANSDIVSLGTTGKRESEIETDIENREILSHNPEPMEITSSEAFDHLMKFKNWAKSRADCLPKHLDYIRELENLTTERKIMAQNPANALLCVGNSKGVVSMWSPNSQQPLAKMLCHHTAINALAVHPYGTYMATSGPDYKVKIWDLRQLAGPLQTVGIRHPANYLSYSQKGLLAIAMGNVVEVFKDTSTDLKPYMRHRENWSVTNMQFCPFEDVLGVATTKGFTSILVPGSGEANFDALELNPFQTKSQRREAEVKALLDKIQPELITLDPYSIHEVDVPSLKDKVEAKKKLLYIKPKDIDFTPRKTKAKGKGGTAKVVKSKKILKQLAKNEAIEAMREANVLKDIKKTEVRKKSFGVLDRFLPKS